MTQTHCSWGDSCSQNPTEMLAHPCLLGHCSQQTSQLTSLDVQHKRVNKENILFMHNAVLFGYNQPQTHVAFRKVGRTGHHGVNRMSSRLGKMKTTCFLFHLGRLGFRKQNKTRNKKMEEGDFVERTQASSMSLTKVGYIHV